MLTPFVDDLMIYQGVVENSRERGGALRDLVRDNGDTVLYQAQALGCVLMNERFQSVDWI